MNESRFFFDKILRYQDTSKYSTVLHNILLILAASKHFLLFSVQTVEAFIDVWRI